jgi:hypothetical protein
VGVSHDGFMTQVQSPAASFVGETSLAAIPEGDRLALYDAVRQQLTPGAGGADFTVAIPGFIPTIVTFRCLRTAGMMMFGRPYDGTAPAGELVGAGFVFSGKIAAEEDEVIRRTSGGRASTGQPYPIPAFVYEKIRGNRFGRCWR